MSKVQKSKYTAGLGQSFIRVATAVPRLKVGDTDYNAQEIQELVKKAAVENVSVVVFPELCITGYTAGDLFHQQLLQKNALSALDLIRKTSINYNMVLCLGLPLS